MTPSPRRLVGLFAALLTLTLSLGAQPSVVRVIDDGAGHYTLTRNGRPYEIRGVGGDKQLELAAKLGATTIRTWGIEQLDQKVDGKTLLDRCEALGLTVMAGIWVQHERHGFNYSDPAQVRRQRDAVRDAVRKYKNHPALLLWGLGNEMEGPISDGRDVRIWKELDELAKIVRQEDPNHPIVTVTAGAATPKIRALAANYPSLDILGVNAYASAPGVGKAVKEAGWNKPFILAEFGPVGHWEVASTSWGAPIEPTSREKAANYYTTHNTVMEDGEGRCLGTFAFVWGQKQETTSTWYGMFLASGEKLPTVDAMSYAWTRRWPDNRSPLIEKLDAPFRHKEIAPSTLATVTVTARDADNDDLNYEWLVVEESTDRKVGGDKESAPPVVQGCIVQADGATLQMRTPSRRGAYRVFCIIRDGKGGASADNFPFYVK
ncbi:MAG: glycoside hydrolase family 2 TIM barrel-domain containing protein [Verrucomicrobiota bacterium]